MATTTDGTEIVEKETTGGDGAAASDTIVETNGEKKKKEEEEEKDLFGSDDDDDEMKDAGAADSEAGAPAPAEPAAEPAAPPNGLQDPNSVTQKRPAPDNDDLFGSDDSSDDDEEAKKKDDLFGDDDSDSDSEKEMEVPLLDVKITAIPRISVASEVCRARLPKFLHVESTPYDESRFDERAEEDKLKAAGRPLAIDNVIRWRWKTNEQGKRVPESNTRILKFSDGSMQLWIGDATKLDITFKNTAVKAEDMNSTGKRRRIDLRAQYIVAQHTDECLETHAPVSKEVTICAPSIGSLAHKKIQARMRKTHMKDVSVKTKVTVMDPEADQDRRIMEHDRQVREANRKRAQQEYSRSRGGGGYGRKRMTADFLTSGAHSDDDDDDNHLSIQDMKRGVRRRGGSQRAAEGEEEELDDSDESDGEYQVSRQLRSRNSAPAPPPRPPAEEDAAPAPVKTPPMTFDGQEKAAAVPPPPPASAAEESNGANNKDDDDDDVMVQAVTKGKRKRAVIDDDDDDE